METGSIVEVYTCGDCGSTVEVSWTGNGVRRLTKGSCLIIHVVGLISGEYCLECKKEHQEKLSDFMQEGNKKFFKKVFDPKFSKLYH